MAKMFCIFNTAVLFTVKIKLNHQLCTSCSAILSETKTEKVIQDKQHFQENDFKQHSAKRVVNMLFPQNHFGKTLSITKLYKFSFSFCNTCT